MGKQIPQRDDTSSATTPSSLQPQQVIALKEAQLVLESTNILDGFNLLGVVANPRGPQSRYKSHSAAVIMSSASNGGDTNQNNGSGQLLTGEHGSGLEDTMLALESTLAGVTEQIDAFNHVVGEWSRHYLGTNAYYEDDYTEYRPPSEQIDAQITELPEELASLSLNTVQDYLTQTSVLAHALDERMRREERSSNDENHEWHESIAPDSIGDLVDRNEEEFMLSLTDRIPSKFFETYFDLTDRNTFTELLVLDNPDYQETKTTTSSSSSQEQKQKQEIITDGSNFVQQLPQCLSESTYEILKLPPADAFSSYLDKVEIALLQQVRAKSIAFFHETNRFGQLKEWISGLVEEVERVRQLLASVSTKSVVAWELIPILDKQRSDLNSLHTILEQAHDVIRCKSSISGLLSANDDLGAAEQIQFGRNLLELEQLHKLISLSTIHDQFTQYENLVVANLGEELVEILLDWGNTSSYNKGATSTTSSSGNNNTRTKDMCAGLQLCRAWTKVEKLYGSRLLDVIRMTVRTTVGEFAEEADSSVKACVTSMTLERFADCLDMLFEQLLDILKSAVCVQEFGKEEGVDFSTSILTAAAELSSKSISELLRLRKEAHSLVSLEEMRRLWDVCINFTLELENESDYKATALRSTLLAQAKAFVERQHESNMSSLVAALDSERWTQCDVSADRQAALTRLCSGRTRSNRQYHGGGAAGTTETTTAAKSPEAEVEGVRCKVVWSCLLLVEMLMNNIACAAHFQSLATNVVGKVAELLRLFNSRSTQLVLGAGAIHSAARLKSINAKHLSLVTQCLGMTIAILPHVRAALMAQLPSKQHGLLQDLDKIRKEYFDHNEKVLNKFVTIIGGIVEHNLAPRILGTNFDARANEEGCCIFLDGVATNTRKMHQVLSALLPPDHLQDVFSRIFAYVDQKIPDLLVAAASGQQFSLPTTDPGKHQMLVEVEKMTTSLNSLPGVRPWEFTAIRVLERQLDYELYPDELNNGNERTNGGVLNDEVSNDAHEEKQDELQDEGEVVVLSKDEEQDEVVVLSKDKDAQEEQDEVVLSKDKDAQEEQDEVVQQEDDSLSNEPIANGTSISF